MPLPTTRRLPAVAAVAAVVLGGGPAVAQPDPDPLAPIMGVTGAGTVPGEYVVVLEDGTSAATARRSVARATRAGGDVEHRFSRTVQGYSATLTWRQLEQVRSDPAVAFVAADRTLRASGIQKDPAWHLDRIDARSVAASRSYSYRATGAGVTAYIVDTRVLTAHDDFGGRAAQGVDTVRTETDCEMEDRAAWHGTHVAGTVGGRRYGVAKDVRVVSVRVLDDCGAGTTASAMAGLEWVIEHHESGPAVVNMSLEGPADTLLDEVVGRVIADGVSVVAAAGNESRNACGSSPARVTAALTVGATRKGDRRDTSYSNYGSCLDLFAPGTSITSLDNSSRAATARSTGTSMAAPQVAGTVALLLEQRPAATPAQVRAAVVGQATRGRVLDRGAGSPDRLLYAMVGVTPPGATSTHNLAPGRALRRDEKLCSLDGRTCLRQRTDGSLALYRSGQAVWSSRTGATWTALGTDGNLVGLDGVRPVWSSGTAGAGPSTLRVRNDGTAVLYRDRDGVALWSAPTTGR